MKSNIQKRLLHIGATLLLLSSTLAATVSAAGEDMEKSMIKTSEMKYAQKETQNLTVLAGVLAQPEPQEWIDARNERVETGRRKAEEDARAASEQATKEAQEQWEQAFPVVAGSSREAAFFNEVGKVSVEIAHAYGIYPSVMMAQAGLESGWGGSELASIYHNYFGVKGSHEGKSVTMRTREESNGRSYYINAAFAHYPSAKESMVQYAELMKNGPGGKNPGFYSGTWRAHANSYKDATQALQGRYATDGIYAQKLNGVIESYGLDRFDEVASYQDIQVTVEPVYPVEPALPEHQYRVTAEDSVLSVAIVNQVTPEQVMEWNGLTEPVIYVNQVLTVKKQEVKPEPEEPLAKPEDVKKSLDSFSRKESVLKEQNKKDLMQKVANSPR